MSDWKMLESGLKRDEEGERFELRDASRMALLYTLATWLGEPPRGLQHGINQPRGQLSRLPSSWSGFNLLETFWNGIPLGLGLKVGLDCQCGSAQSP